MGSDELSVGIAQMTLAATVFIVLAITVAWYWAIPAVVAIVQAAVLRS